MSTMLNNWNSKKGLFLILCSGLMICVMSKNMFLVWVGLELKMFGVMPFITNRVDDQKKVVLSKSSEMKISFFYFLVQVMGSLFMLCGAVLKKWYAVSVMGLLVKLGLPPFFWWVPAMMSRMDWLSMALLSTMQKVPGIILLRLCFDMELEVSIMLSLLGLMCASMGMKSSYNNLKKLMGWSSVSKMSLLLLLSVFKSKLGWMYYLFYSVLVISFCSLISEKSDSSMYSMLLLIFSGLPPFLGFVFKIYFMKGFFFLSSTWLWWSGVPMFPYFLESWNLCLLFLFMITLQSMGYIKAFINIQSSIDSLRVKKKFYNWTVTMVIYIGCIMMVGY